ncbi:hypothetical protein BABINDRAFT_173047 [Babjeviella inositovora NRRL Y-12698]|uniref:Fatty acid desaturase domain-containing protein n=1 Tax=Babjeviella inositovora NRRL Y-12698 TaxID=984486 RepID=A0A1E3QH11_9ASCO|nr:uncharacterized protein BABINDRAFT_173047 [Babjeviella inositovora NRRL Y-12698]ODQ76971.1 hypothetical protein BABINDRAFT_173047 [Babjeviella inositovora NRRL Y-12698]
MSSQVKTSGSSIGDSATITRKGNVSGFSKPKENSAIDAFGKTFNAPMYTIKDILSAIPAHSYERRLTTSFYYVFRDIAMMATMGYVANTYIAVLPFAALRFAAWFAYVFVQGLIGTGVWVLAHECGHQAFSDYGLVNDTVGWILHSYLMVPYFSWKYSHGKHHKATGHLTRDMVFVPYTKEQYLKKHNVTSAMDLVEEAPAVALWSLFLQQFGGWWAHLLSNVSGQPFPDTPAYAKSHFWPSSKIFDKRDYWFIVLSDVGIASMLFVLYKWYQNFGLFNVAVNWFLPYLWVNHWLVFITYLQHSDPKMPHYEAEQWNFARGAAATIDREFGFIGKHLFHDIIETHVLHHYVSRIPFYNAREATVEIKKVMGEHYMYSDENMFVALWNSKRWCQFVEGDNGIMMFRNSNGLGVAPK